MKKIILIVLSLILIVSMTGCGINFNFGQTNNSNKKDNSQIDTRLDNTTYVAGDSSYLILGSNSTLNNFNWYQSQDNLTDNYYAGMYTAYFGDNAAKFITEDKSCYGVTKEELSRVSSGDYSKLVVLYVNYSEIMIDGKSKLAEFNNSIDKDNPKSITYYGEIDEKGNLSLVNMASANIISFTKIDNAEINKDIDKDTPEDIENSIDEIKDDSNNIKSENEALNKIKVDIPKNYVLINSTDTYLLYLDYDNDNGITIFFYDGEESLKYAKQHKGGKDIKVDGHDAYRYVDDGDYCCSILGNGGEYIIETDDESTLDNILKTMKL